MKISEYKQLFLSETQEMLRSMNRTLVELEKKPASPDLINELFRQSHTLKAMAQTMKYGKIAELTHSMESTLALFRSGKLRTEKSTVDLLFRSLDTLDNLVKEVREEKARRTKVAPLVERFEEIASAVPAKERRPRRERRSNLRLDDIDRRRIMEQRNKGVIAYRATVSLKPGVKKKKERALSLVKKLQTLGEVIRAPFVYKQFEGRRFGRHFGLFFMTKYSPDDVKKEIEAVAEAEKMILRPLEIDEIILPSKKKRAEEGPAVFIPAGEAHTVRVPLAQLDSLMDAVGELAINRIRLVKIAREREDKPLKEAVTRMSRLTSELQDQMLRVRLIPLEYIFAPYPRMVRDMAVAGKKDVDLVIRGSNIGLDRTIQDEINEPLLHLLKNAVVHGIETPGERERLKKTKGGKINLTAARERNYVVIEVSDDGRGIDTEEIKKLAVKRGLITKEEILGLTPKEAAMLIAFPGYSGARKVTEAAGRGVGLDAVKVRVESFGGTLDIDTAPNKGTSFSVRLPLTMSIVQSMLVGIADETYCIPLSHVAETIKVLPDQIKTIERHEVISYRDTVLPLVKLRERFGFGRKEAASPQAGAGTAPDRASAILVVVAEVGTRRAGLVVDSVLGQQDVVIKPLTGILKRLRGVSGATILGTGKAALIADVPALL